MKKLTAIVLMAVMLTGILNGCGGVPAEAAESKSTVNAAETADAGDTADKEDAADSADKADAADAGKAVEKTDAADKEDTTDSADTENTPDADEYYARLKKCKSEIEQITDFKPDIVLVLGTGLGEFADDVEKEVVIPYTDIPSWPNTTVSAHKGNLVLAKYKGLNLAIMQGRIHYYEGYSMHEVVLPLRVLHMLGANTVIITNAVGAINEDYKVGDFVCLNDHISSFVPSPLIGPNIEEFGERYTTMNDVYDEELQKKVMKIGEEENIPIHSGIMVQTTGPQFETPAEIRMYRTLGADTVGMSTVVEAIAARHMGMRVCTINNVTNMAAGVEEEGFSNDSIDEASKDSIANFKKLVSGLLDEIAEE